MLFVLGVSPALDRLLTIDDDQASRSSPWLCSRTTSGRGNSEAQDIVGQKVLVNRHPMTVASVAAPMFHGIDVGEVPSLWIPRSHVGSGHSRLHTTLDRRTRWMQILGRLMLAAACAGGQFGRPARATPPLLSSVDRYYALWSTQARTEIGESRNCEKASWNLL